MSNKTEIIFIFIFVILISFILASCKDSVVNTPLTPEPDNTPMWPQAGYNAQNTGNPYAPKVKCEPVNGGVVDWYYQFPNASYSDGAEFCVDSKNNIYYYSQLISNMKIFKFRSDGSVIWSINVTGEWNFASISLNSDESKIYFISALQLCCYDSAGILNWCLGGSGMYPKPSIGKDGTIYTNIDYKVTAVNPDGTIKWKSDAELPIMSTYFALDREENIYVGGTQITKIDKYGNILWRYKPKVQEFFTRGLVIDGYGNLYFSNYSYNYNNSDFFSITKDGTPRWSAITSSSYTMPVISTNNLIYNIGGNNVFAFDTSGKLLWTYPNNYTIDYQGPVIDDDNNLYYFIEGSRGTITAKSLNSAGELRWSVDVFTANILPRPALLPMGRMLIAPKRAYKIACVK